jgi:hypothetical protein
MNLSLRHCLILTRRARHFGRCLALLVVAILASGATAPAMADHGDCGQPSSQGSKAVTSDALSTLLAAVGAAPCSVDADECVCDVDGNGSITASDALWILGYAVGLRQTLACAEWCGATTTSSSTMVTSTTMMTTTTTLDGPWEPGRLLYDQRCGFCHSLSGYDATGFAGNLANRGNLLRADLGRISGSMTGITLTAGEIADLMYFLDGTRP